MTITYTNTVRARLSLLQPGASPWTNAHGYDALKRLASLVSPAGSCITETFASDANNQLTSAHSSGTLTVSGLASGAAQVSVNGQGAMLYADKSFVVTGLPLTTTNLTAVARDGAGHAATHTITVNSTARGGMDAAPLANGIR
jgi:hypothetical protein